MSCPPVLTHVVAVIACRVWAGHKAPSSSCAVAPGRPKRPAETRPRPRSAARMRSSSATARCEGQTAAVVNRARHSRRLLGVWVRQCSVNELSVGWRAAGYLHL